MPENAAEACAEGGRIARPPLSFRYLERTVGGAGALVTGYTPRPVASAHTPRMVVA